MLFTRRDNPHEANKNQQKLAKNKAKDLNDIGILLEVVPVALKNEEFDFSKFYGVNMTKRLIKHLSSSFIHN